VKLCSTKNNGKGNGIAAAALNPKPADHTSAALQKESDEALYWKMTEAHTPMPSYNQALTDTQRWMLVNYIR
jgi:mono/diheme cytochrome c family protein